MSCFNNKKEKGKNLLEAYRKEQKESLIFEAIALDNTNPNIIYEYLNIIEQKDRQNFLMSFQNTRLLYLRNYF